MAESTPTSTNGTASLVTWLRAQLDEDERVARSLGDVTDSTARNGIASTSWPSVLNHLDRFGMARVLAEVEAKRRILDWLVALEDKALDGNWWNIEVSDAVKLLALPYAGEPGYDESWRP